MPIVIVTIIAVMIVIGIVGTIIIVIAAIISGPGPRAVKGAAMRPSRKTAYSNFMRRPWPMVLRIMTTTSKKFLAYGTSRSDLRSQPCL